MKTIEHADYPIHAAGRLWTIDRIRLAEMPDGVLGVSRAELARVHKAVANFICGQSGLLTGEELEFLCDVTDTRYAEIARLLDIDRSTITLWRRKGVVPKRATSLNLKRWFWFRLFGADMADTLLPLSSVGDDEELLRCVRREAIRADMTFEVRERRVG